MSTAGVGRPLSRVDGRLKVTGAAWYAAEADVANVAHATLVLSSIASGKITALETSEAEHAPGVIAVLSWQNVEHLYSQEPEERPGVDPDVGEPLPPLQDDVVRYHSQPIAVVVAETFERAVHAATLVRASYQEWPAVLDFAAAAANATPPQTQKSGDRPSKRAPDYQRGDPEEGLAQADVRVDQTYTIAAENHNAMELHATVAVWDGPKLTLYDKTQWVNNVQDQVARAFGMAKDDVRVISPFVGGAFGAGLRVWPHTLIAALAARHVGRPVKLMLTRAQQYTVPGYRPLTVQRVALGARGDGTLTALIHEGTAQTSVYEEYTESLLNVSRFLYACPNVVTRYRLAAMHVNTPNAMRAPGEASGVYALEAALDELAVALGIDPVELRLRNHADTDPTSGLPWSSKSLKECYREAAARFGWNRRNPTPRAMREGRMLVGYGMASATWPANRQPATVAVRLQPDGTADVCTAASDIGPGTYTAMTQIAADALGLPVERVRFALGDTAMPRAPVEGGSMTVASVGSAVHEAALAARARLNELARGESPADWLRRHGPIEVTHESKPGKEKKHHSMYAFGAQFAEVHVDPDLCTIRVARVVSGFAAGRIINPKTARSQAIGGIVGGIGMALLEQVVRDPRNGRVVNSNLADYHLPVNADVPALDAFFVEEHDAHVNPLGAKGLAELSLVGIAAAIANAVYHATGKRVRDLPITPDKLL